MTTFYWPTDDLAAYRLRRQNRLPPAAPGVPAPAPYPRTHPVGREAPRAEPRPGTPVPEVERRGREDRRRRQIPVLFDRRSGSDRRAMAAIKPRIDVYC